MSITIIPYYNKKINIEIIAHLTSLREVSILCVKCIYFVYFVKIIAKTLLVLMDFNLHLNTADIAMLFRLTDLLDISLAVKVSNCGKHHYDNKNCSANAER